MSSSSSPKRRRVIANCSSLALSPPPPLPDLPDDIINEILYQLPALTLLKFRCVSKSWRSLISSQQFAQIHLKNNKNRSRVLIKPDLHSPTLIHCPLTHLLSKTRPTPTIKPPITPPLGFQFDSLFTKSQVANCRDPFLRIVSSCNGIICLTTHYETHLLLWNPTTRTHKSLPLENNKPGACSPCVFGFGFVNGDYKVFSFFNSLTIHHPQLRLYSLTTNQWTKVQAVPTQPAVHLASKIVFGNGKFYWLGICARGKIVALHYFDVEMEDCGNIQIPVDGNTDERNLAISEEKLHLFCFRFRNMTLWRLDGISRWNMLCRIQYDDFGPMINCDPHFYADSCSVLDNGEVMMSSTDIIVIFNPKDRSSIRFSNIGFPLGIIRPCPYDESLVSL